MIKIMSFGGVHDVLGGNYPKRNDTIHYCNVFQNPCNLEL